MNERIQRIIADILIHKMNGWDDKSVIKNGLIQNYYRFAKEYNDASVSKLLPIAALTVLAGTVNSYGHQLLIDHFSVIRTAQSYVPSYYHRPLNSAAFAVIRKCI